MHIDVKPTMHIDTNKPPVNLVTLYTSICIVGFT